MTRQDQRSLKYWLGATVCALIGSVGAFCAGVWAYNEEVARIRAEVGVGGCVDGRVPFELPLYVILGAVAGWWVFHATAKYVRRDAP